MSSQDKFVLTIKTDLTLIKIYTITLDFGSDTCQVKVQIVQVRQCLDACLEFHPKAICSSVVLLESSYS